ncbi:hypothetical protein H0E87_006162 [Populus deltoides]|uniref:protein-serine/threonine phosphatase n=11 Tax=Populus TaxID=3689 RepID=A0A8T2Z5P8_POPDE|nr:hypothetical protein H0E87_006162 [Populus deltoides]
MGVYLSSPKTDKASQDGENDRLRYGLSSMQGWRTTMEDAHAAYPDLDISTSFFGVYDGHGGIRVGGSIEIGICFKISKNDSRGKLLGFLLATNNLKCKDTFRTYSKSLEESDEMDDGQAVAKFCAKYLHQQVLRQESYLSGDLGTSLQKAFLRMDEMMRGQRGWRELASLGDNIEKVSGMIEGLIWSPRRGQVNGNLDDWPSEEGPHSSFHGPTSGSTACVAIIRNNQLFVANAGDSRCVISRKGQAFDMSKDHKPDLVVERERIVNAGGFIVVGRVNGTLNLSRAIGDAELKQNKKLPAEQQIVTANPDIRTVELCDDDEFLVLACDGIWDCMSSQQLVDYVREQLNTETKLSVICGRVFHRCLAPDTNGGEGCDNMTMILVQFKKPVKSGPSTEQQPPSSHQAMKRVCTGFVGVLPLERERKRSVSEFVVSSPAQLPCWSASFSFTIILFTVLFVLFMAADAENVIEKEETTQSRDSWIVFVGDLERMASAAAVGMMGGNGGATLKIQPGASESEVKKAFRQLALQYHPDVCRGSNCGVQFSLINEAYDIVMSNLREEPDESSQMYRSYEPSDQGIDEPMRGMNDPDWDMWEEWMGWEGAGIRDYSSHINPYI